MKKLMMACLFALLILFGCLKNRDNRIPIAILIPVTHPSLEQIEKGFIQTMEAENPGKYRFVTYNAQGNKILMHSELEEIVQQNYALVLTVGTLASQMTIEFFNKKMIKIPVVFTCVNDPVGFHIVNAEQSTEKVTGVKELLKFREELTALLQFKPNLKTILLVYNPIEPGLKKDRKEVEHILQDKDISLITVEVFQSNEIMAKVSPFMENSDALIVLKDNTVIAGLDVLVKLCNRHHIPLMASDLDSPDRGAAFGYGVYEIEFGIEAAKKASLILNQGVDPAHIPITPLSSFILKINSQAAQEQGINLSLIHALNSEDK